MGKALQNIPSDTLSDDAARLISLALSKNTRRGYAADLRDWSEWCTLNSVDSKNPPPQSLANYFAFLASSGMKYATICRRKCALRSAFSVAAMEQPDKPFVDPTRDPRVRAVIQGVARDMGRAPYKKKALEVEQLRQVVARIEPTIKGIRDRALLCMLFAGAFRGSELLGLNVEDVKVHRDRLVIHIKRSKTDQEGKGQYITLPATFDPICPVTAYMEWISKSELRTGPVFRRVFASANDNAEVGVKRYIHRSLAQMVKARTAAAGLEGDYSGHSGRSGFVTSAMKRGVYPGDIMAVTRHKNIQSMNEYRQVSADDQMSAINIVMG